MALSTWDIDGCCCDEDEFPVCDGVFSLPGTLPFTDSMLGTGAGTHQVGGPHDHGFGYWEGDLVFDFPGTGPDDFCSPNCPPKLGAILTYRLIPQLFPGEICGFTAEVEFLADDTQLCLEPGAFADVCRYDSTIFTPPPAFFVSDIPLCAGSFYIILAHGCSNDFTITWSQ